MIVNRRTVLAMTAGLAATGVARAQTALNLPFQLRGRFTQGGWCVGRALPDTELTVDGRLRGRTAPDGLFYVGFDRDAPAACTIRCAGQDATLAIAPVTYDVQRVDGLPQDTVTPRGQALLDRIGREWLLKNVAFASHDDSEHFKNGFIWPLKTFIVSGHFGNQRILNGKPSSPHMGFDMAAPIGTPIHAPQDGLVVLAQADMFYEGGLIFIDHGQGAISMYLHQSAVLVKLGQRVRQGQLIGRVGDRGRATGPHLCWRLKWSDRHLDPSLMVA
ncbi:M23 family metallopeptidase [Asticcacaulis sp. EMRT-3]|uniref:M23 family metallopeptidase n=1 Tax=Asticcacaulis sp. EMRT-3 TaxID=3040349 RepID=UPI0024AF3E2A|nr:M23 family metallopeptidase [Asticcacaulis sp. EMRT-3]MDI7774903.1 M23 family metallopeptidase [Asticcacaulis sp. EMRT-3]